MLSGLLRWLIVIGVGLPGESPMPCQVWPILGLRRLPWRNFLDERNALSTYTGDGVPRGRGLTYRWQNRERISVAVFKLLY